MNEMHKNDSINYDQDGRTTQGVNIEGGIL